VLLPGLGDDPDAGPRLCGGHAHDQLAQSPVGNLLDLVLDHHCLTVAVPGDHVGRRRGPLVLHPGGLQVHGVVEHIDVLMEPGGEVRSPALVHLAYRYLLEPADHRASSLGEYTSCIPVPSPPTPCGAVGTGPHASIARLVPILVKKIFSDSKVATVTARLNLLGEQGFPCQGFPES
jgi:hypothetical protein